MLNYLVYPSSERTISVQEDDKYGGAHNYTVRNSTGFDGGRATYDESTQTLQFVQKLDDGTIIPGLQSEQLALIMYDRVEKLNAVYPSEYNERMKEALDMFLRACMDRIIDRMDRGVMGQLKV